MWFTYINHWLSTYMPSLTSTKSDLKFNENAIIRQTLYGMMCTLNQWINGMAIQLSLGDCNAWSQAKTNRVNMKDQRTIRISIVIQDVISTTDFYLKRKQRILTRFSIVVWFHSYSYQEILNSRRLFFIAFSWYMNVS